MMKQRGHRSERARARIELCHKKGGGFRRKRNCEFLGSADASCRDESGGYVVNSRAMLRNKHGRRHGDSDFSGRNIPFFIKFFLSHIT